MPARIPSGSSHVLQTIFAIGTAAAMFFAASCGSSSETLTSPSQTRCTVAAQAQGQTFPAAGGSGSIRITTNRECTWTARSDAPWITLTSPVTGQGEGSIPYSVAANPEPASRSAGISVEDQRLQVSQEGRPCEYRLSSTRESLDSAGGERTIQVATDSTQCRWTAAANVPWITILAGGEGSGSGVVSFRAEPAIGSQRTGTITIAGQAVQVDQGTGCSFAISTTTLTFGAAGGAGEVAVTSPPGCTWTAESRAPWITVTSGSAGSGSGLAAVRVAATDGPPRTSTLIVAGQTVTVTQSPGCSYTVDPSAYNAPAAGGPGTVVVRTADGCPWTAISGADWISLATTSGSGTGEVRFTVGASSGPARSAVLSIVDRAVTVNQASGCSVSLSPSSISIGAVGGSGAVQVETPPVCSWSAASGASWVTITGGQSGSGNGQVQLAMAGNTGPARQTTVTVEGRAVSVAQASGCTYSVTPNSHDISGVGGNSAVTVATAAGCPWTAATHVDWITPQAPAASGPGQMSFAIAANPGPARSGTLTIAGQIVTVNQASPCGWAFAPPTHFFPATGGAGTTLVIVTGGCTWTAESHSDWIRITDIRASFVQFTTAPNPGAARTGTLTIAGQRYEITQAGQ
jgi:hypothetical protein